MTFVVKVASSLFYSVKAFFVVLLFIQQFGARSSARDSANNDGHYSAGSSSYYAHRTNTIDYGHQGVKETSSSDVDYRYPWSSGHYNTERHHTADKSKGTPPGTEADQPSKMDAVQKAMEMAQRTREIVSKLGGMKQASQHSEGSSSFTDSSLQPSVAFSPPKSQSLEMNAPTTKSAAVTADSAMKVLRQNTSLIKYAFNLSGETEHMKDSGSSLPRHDTNSSWADDGHKYGTAFETPVQAQSPETKNYAVTAATADVNYENNTTAYSQENAWNVAPAATQEPAKTDSCDPTIANILKSIGFNFDLSNTMQDKARKESESSVSQSNATESSSQANRVASYEERASRYRAEQMRQYGIHKPDNREDLHWHDAVDSSAEKSSLHMLQKSYDDKPFAEDMIRDSSVDLKLKYKASDRNVGQKSDTLYEDFSDSDDDFAATATMNVNKSNPELSPQSIPLNKPSVQQQVSANKTADDLDWEQSTEEFIRKLQQPREQQRTVTVVPKSESMGHHLPALSERLDSDTPPTQSDNFKLSKSFVPLEELRTIKKTIIVSESPVKSESSAGKSDTLSSGKSAKNSYTTSSGRDKTPKSQQRTDSSLRSAEKANIDSGHKKKRESDIFDDRDDMPTTGSKVAKLDTNSPTANKEKQRKIEALLRELENLKRQQNILMRRKKRDKDPHKDTFLMQNSKLQEEICNQIDKLRKASQQAADSSENQTSDQVYDAVCVVLIHKSYCSRLCGQ